MKDSIPPPKRDNEPVSATASSQEVIDEMKRLPPDRDLHSDSLEELMSFVNSAAIENFADAARCGDPDVRAGIIRFAVNLTESYAKLLTARDKHRKFMGR